jgi:hypothetical protein
MTAALNKLPAIVMVSKYQVTELQYMILQPLFGYCSKSPIPYQKPHLDDFIHTIVKP